MIWIFVFYNCGFFLLKMRVLWRFLSKLRVLCGYNDQYTRICGSTRIYAGIVATLTRTEPPLQIISYHSHPIHVASRFQQLIILLASARCYLQSRENSLHSTRKAGSRGMQHHSIASFPLLIQSAPSCATS